ncbi:MAG: hypothetical protein K2M06_01875 [Muribaculaceae bacterium]|nr:hypothetical protein [Muribaculaceae bacterium]
MALNPILKDLSGNDLDMQCNGFAWTDESGISEDGGIKFDGVDDYCLQSGTRPQLQDFTVIFKNKVEENYRLEGYLCADNNTSAKDALFSYGIGSSTNGFSNDSTVVSLGYYRTGYPTNSFGTHVTCLTSNKIFYDDGRTKNISKGSYNDSKVYPIIIGRSRTHPEHIAPYSEFNFYSFLLFNRTLTEDEINWVKTNLIRQ